MSLSDIEIRYSGDAFRALRRSNKRDLIRKKIEELAANPEVLAGNITRLQGRPEYRLRVQDWRIIYRLEEGIVWIDAISPRGSAYEVL